MCYFGLNFLNIIFYGMQFVALSLIIMGIGAIKSNDLIERVKNDVIKIFYFIFYTIKSNFLNSIPLLLSFFCNHYIILNNYK
jgi:hypothetical protein